MPVTALVLHLYVACLPFTARVNCSVSHARAAFIVFKQGVRVLVQLVLHA